jgi:transposase
LSVISAITVSPLRKRVGLYFKVLRHNVKTGDVVRFMRALRRKVGRRVTFVLDGLPAHRGAQRVLENKGYGFVRFPAYAPDLNPDEWVWRHAKYVELRNTAMYNVDCLEHAIVKAMHSIGSRPQLLRSFFRGAGLSLYQT